MHTQNTTCQVLIDTFIFCTCEYLSCKYKSIKRWKLRWRNENDDGGWEEGEAGHEGEVQILQRK